VLAHDRRQNAAGVDEVELRLGHAEEMAAQLHAVHQPVRIDAVSEDSGFSPKSCISMTWLLLSRCAPCPAK